jgi:hypothetical protein
MFGFDAIRSELRECRCLYPLPGELCEDATEDCAEDRSNRSARSEGGKCERTRRSRRECVSQNTKLVGATKLRTCQRKIKRRLAEAGTVAAAPVPCSPRRISSVISATSKKS